jgi:hypothetical protein
MLVSDWLFGFGMGHDGSVKARCVLFPLLLAVFAASGQDTNLLLMLEPVPLFPELHAAATANGIPVDGIVPPTSTNTLSPGDSLTALIVLHQKGNHRTEWLVYFQVVPATNDPPAKPSKSRVIYNSTGDKFEFAKSPVVFHIRTLGPYVDTESFWGKPLAKDNGAQVSVNGTFLSLGLGKGAAAINRLYRAHGTNFNFWVTDRPPSNEEAQKNQKIAATLRVTPEEKRAMAGWFPALMCYFQAVGETPDLDTIMWKVVSLPSMWSVVRHVGVRAWMGMDFDNVCPLTLPAKWGVPGGSNVFTLPIMVELNQQPALNATLLVTDPRPSLLACGGIVGFVAQNPNDDQNFVTLRVISTRPGTGAKEK